MPELLQKTTASAVTLMAVALGYAIVATARESSITDTLQVVAVSIVMPCGVMAVSVYRSNSLFAMFVAWIVVVLAFATVYSETNCKRGPDCGWLLVMCVVLVWIAAIVVAISASRRQRNQEES